MAELKDGMGFQDKIHIVLTGPDGKVKDERKPEEDKDARTKRHGLSQQTRN